MEGEITYNIRPRLPHLTIHRRNSLLHNPTLLIPKLSLRIRRKSTHSSHLSGDSGLRREEE